MATTNGHRNGPGRPGQADQLYRLQLLLDVAYLISSLLLAVFIATSPQVQPAASGLAAVFGPVLLWGLLLYRRASAPLLPRARFPVYVWTLMKAVALGALLAVGAFMAAKGPLALRTGPWLVSALNFVVLALELPYLFLCRRANTADATQGRKLLVVGSGKRVSDFLRHVADSRLPVRVAGIVGRNARRVGRSILGIPIIGRLEDLPSILKRTQVDEVVFLLSRTWLDLVEKPMLLCESAGVRVLLSTDVYPFRLSSPRIEEMGDLRLLAFDSVNHSELAVSLKGAFDFALAALLLVLSLPLSLLTACAIKLTSRGPVFFRQERAGLNGRRFQMWKFRTMVVGAEEMKGELSARNEMSGPVFKMKEDPRVTALGRFLRRMSLDELPQLINVLRGEMSLVGPRPPVPAEVEQYDSWQRRRLSVKPGLTGVWQTSGRNRVSFEDWARMDLEYIDNWSLWLDLKLLCKTVPAVLAGTGM